jgi:hypothetical protein
MENYRAHIVYCSTTGHKRTSDTVEFLPQHCKLPGISSADVAAIAAADLTHALQNSNPNTLFKQPGTERIQAIKKLASIFEEMAPQKEPPTRVEATEQRTSIPPRVEAPPTQKAPSPRVPRRTTMHTKVTKEVHYKP